MKYVFPFLTILLLGCFASKKFSEDDHITGVYKTFYVKDNTISRDSMWIKIELYDIVSGEPLKFDNPMSTLNEHPNKTIVDNYCIAYFHRKEVPKSIFLELHRAGKYPKTFFPILKNNKQIIFKAYLANDTRVNI